LSNAHLTRDNIGDATPGEALYNVQLNYNAFRRVPKFEASIRRIFL